MLPSSQPFLKSFAACFIFDVTPRSWLDDSSFFLFEKAFTAKYPINPPVAAIGNVPATAVPKAAIPTDDPIQPPAAAPPIVPIPSLVRAISTVFL